MLLDRGDRLRMTRGDYGVPLTLCVRECYQDCGNDLEPDDVIRVCLFREEQALFTREVTWGELEEEEGVWELLLTPEEAAMLPLGLYTFRVCLLRAGQVRNTLMTSILEVIP